RRPMLALQLLLELVNKPPIGALCEERLRAALDETSFVETKRVEAERIRGAVLAPLAIRGNLLEHLQRLIAALRNPPVPEQPGAPLWLQGADLTGLQDGPKHPLRCHRILAHKLTVADDEAAEVLGPGPIHPRVDQYVPNLLLAQLDTLWLEGHEGVDLAFDEECPGLQNWVRNPVDVPVRIQAHGCSHAAHEGVVGKTYPRHGDRSPL